MSVLTRLSAAARLFSSLPRRCYGSSAAAQLDYDYYYEEEEEEEEEPHQKSNRREMVELGEWETVGRGVQWVIMSDPMVRRHAYAEGLAKLLDVPHISMGTLVRQELNPSSSLYKKIANAVNQGKLVPEDVIFGLLSKRLEEGYSRGETGFILDGIPRTRMQAEILDQVADIDLVLNLKYTEESVVKKTIGNRIYSPREFPSMAAAGFNLSFQPPVGHLQSSGADSETMWKDKLRMYAEQKKPLEEYYNRQKKLLDFEVAGAPVDTWNGLLAALQLQHMNVVTSSSQKVTA